MMEQGDQRQARKILSELLREEPNQVEYWLWMSAVVDSKKEQIYCLRKVLSLDPDNLDAKKGLMLFGALEPEKVGPITLKKRDWSKDLPDLDQKLEHKQEKKQSRFQPKRALPAIGMLGILLILLLTGVIKPGGRWIFAPRLTVTPFTLTPSLNPEQIAALTGTPNPILLTPIGEVLQATYTSTPVYVNTPHPGYSSYRTAVEAYEQGDFQTMLTYMRSTANQLETADIVYLVGEALRNLGRYEEAAEEYQRALFLDPSFGPAYLGRALNSRALNPGAEIKGDLDAAIASDDQFGEAYLERAYYYVDNQDYSQALADANQAVSLLPNSPLAHLVRAESLLGLGEVGSALDAGKRALELDLNHVPTYYLMGRIYLELNQPGRALSYLIRYGPYISPKPWEVDYALGKAYYLSDRDLTAALQYLSSAIDKNGTRQELYLTRGKVHLELGNAQAALVDAFAGRNLNRDNFDVNVFLGEMLYRSEQYSMAEIILRQSEDLAATPAELAAVLYWRAQARTARDQIQAANEDWQRLIDLPDTAVPQSWRLRAEKNLLPTSTPTATIPSPTFTLTATPSPTATSTSTPTASLTPAPTITATAEPTPNPDS